MSATVAICTFVRSKLPQEEAFGPSRSSLTQLSFTPQKLPKCLHPFLYQCGADFVSRTKEIAEGLGGRHLLYGTDTEMSDDGLGVGAAEGF